jgi:hypothetical protein
LVVQHNVLDTYIAHSEDKHIEILNYQKWYAHSTKLLYSKNILFVHLWKAL